MTLIVKKKRVCMDLVLYTFVFYIISQTDAIFLRYACKPNGDLSVMNVNASYKSALAFNTMGNCVSTVVKNFTVIKITNCPPGDESGMVKIVLSQLKKDRLDYVGGRDQITSSVRCSLPKRATSSLVRINMRVRGLFRQVSGFSHDFYNREPTLSIETYDLTGETGYDVFTISYPIGVVITGPPESDILPEVCHAYSARNIENGLTARVLKNGCALDHNLMFSFSKEPADWFDRNITEFDMDRFILTPGMYDDPMIEEREEAPLLPPPQLFTHMYAFRFFLSNYILVHCEVRICPPGSESCALPCNDTIKADENGQTESKNEGKQLEDMEEDETETGLDESESEEEREIEKHDDSPENEIQLEESDTNLQHEEEEEEEDDLQDDVGEFDDSEPDLEHEKESEIEQDDSPDNENDFEESEPDLEEEEEIEGEQDNKSLDIEAELDESKVKTTEIPTSALHQDEFTVDEDITITTNSDQDLALTTLPIQKNDMKTYSNQIIGGRADSDKRIPIKKHSVKESETTSDVGRIGTTLLPEEVISTTESYDEENELSGSLDPIPSLSHRRKRALRRNNYFRTRRDLTTKTLFRKFIIRRNSALKPHYVWDTLPQSDFDKYESDGRKKVGESETDMYTITDDKLNSQPRILPQRGHD